MPPKQAAGKAAPAAKKEPKKPKKEENEVERIPPPDRAAFEAKVEAVQAKIDALMAGMSKISEQIKEANSGQGEFMAKKNELMEKKRLLTDKIEAIMGDQEKLQRDVSEKKADAANLRNDVGKMKRQLKFESEGDIDERIATIEFKLLTSTMPLAEEKAYLKEISELKKNRPQLAKIRTMEQGIGAAGDTGALREQITGNKQDLGMFRDARTKVQKELSELIGSRTSDFDKLKELYAKRDVSRKEIEDLKQERTELRDAFKEEEREFNRKRREQQDAKNRIYEEKRREDQAERDQKYREREADKIYEDDPNAKNIALVEQTVKWCQSLLPAKEAEAATEEKKEIKHDLPAGAEVLTRKEDRDEFFFVPTAKKKSKAKNKSEKGGSKAIRHNGMSFEFFKLLKLDAPLTTDDLPPLLEKLQEMQADLAEKTKEWEATREEKRRAILAGELDPRARKSAARKSEDATAEAADATPAAES